LVAILWHGTSDEVRCMTLRQWGSSGTRTLKDQMMMAGAEGDDGGAARL
jgi:hypothetical protein